MPLEILDRVQTALYLVQSLDIDIAEVTVMKGHLDPQMMRKTSYFTLDIPALSRVLQICDEEENASYIFDKHELEVIGITVERLNAMSKKEKNELLYTHQKRALGVRFIYSSQWGERLTDLLASDALPVPVLTSPNGGSTYTVEAAPAGYEAVTKFAQRKRLGKETLDMLIEREKLTLPLMRFGNRTTTGLSPEVKSFLLSLPELSFTLPEDDVQSVKRYAIKKGLAREVLQRLVDRYQIPTQEYKFGSRVAPGLSLASQHLVDALPELAAPIATDDIQSVHTFAADRHITVKRFEALMAECDIIPGTYKFGGQIAAGLTEAQRQKLDEHPFLRVPFAGSEIESISRFAKRMHSSMGMVGKYIEQSGIEPATYRFHTILSTGLTEDQAIIVESLLRADRPSDSSAVSVASIREEYNLTAKTTQRLLDEHGIETIMNVFTTTLAQGLVPEMADHLRNAIEARARAPEEGELAVNSFVSENGLTPNAVAWAMKELGITELDTVRFDHHTTGALSRTQQNTIKQAIVERDQHKPAAGELSLGVAARELGMHIKTLLQTADILGITFATRWSSGKYRPYLTVEMQAQIRAYRSNESDT